MSLVRKLYTIPYPCHTVNKVASAGNRLKWKEQDHHGLLAVHFVRLLHNTLFLHFFFFLGGGEGRERGVEWGRAVFNFGTQYALLTFNLLFSCYLSVPDLSHFPLTPVQCFSADIQLYVSPPL